MAQLGARLNGIQEVTGSNPVRSTTLSPEPSIQTRGTIRQAPVRADTSSDDPTFFPQLTCPLTPVGLTVR